MNPRIFFALLGSLESQTTCVFVERRRNILQQVFPSEEANGHFRRKIALGQGTASERPWAIAGIRSRSDQEQIGVVMGRGRWLASDEALGGGGGRDGLCHSAQRDCGGETDEQP